MQLATSPDLDTLVANSKKLASASSLLYYFDNPPPEQLDSYVYSLLWSFPLAKAAFDSCKRKSLAKMTQAQRLELKLKLKEEIAPLLVEIERMVSEDKFFKTEQVAADPEACLAQLCELKEKKRKQMEELQEEIELLDEVVEPAIAELVASKNQAVVFTEAMFTSLPADVSSKKPKNA
jgi:hypothetical protein